MKPLATVFIVALVFFAYSTSVISGSAGGATKITIKNAGKYKNQIQFVSDTPLEKVTGNVDEVKGSFVIDLQDISVLSGSVVIPVRSMKTGHSGRDKHMYSKEWLDAEQFENITYTITSLKSAKIESSNGRSIIKGIVVGEFELHGVKKSMESKVEIVYLTASDETKKIADGDFVLVKTSFEISLKDYQIAGKSGLVGSKVGENIQVTAQIFGTSK